MERVEGGYPERFARQALGHNSKAVHHAYSKHAEVTVPSLDDWEKEWERQPGARGQRTEHRDLAEHEAMPEPAVAQVDFQAHRTDSADAPVEGPAAAAAQGR